MSVDDNYQSLSVSLRVLIRLPLQVPWTNQAERRKMLVCIRIVTLCSYAEGELS